MSSPESNTGEHDRSIHQPVLLRETIDHLDLHPGQIVVDGTVGGGGHSQAILEQIGPSGLLIGCDRDAMMLNFARLKLDQPNCHLVQTSYAQIPEVLAALPPAFELGSQPVDRILLDLGLSSDQLQDDSRGFSFESTGSLDLRFDRSEGIPAWQMIAEMNEQDLVASLQQGGEERFATAIASAIVNRRQHQPIKSSQDLCETVTAAIPSHIRRDSRKHPATRVFQALRIAVNRELDQLKTALESAIPDVLKPGGRLAVISFHSLEDRIVKRAFRSDQQWEELTKKPVEAMPIERRMNPRSRTAKLRVARKR